MSAEIVWHENNAVPRTPVTDEERGVLLRELMDRQRGQIHILPSGSGMNAIPDDWLEQFAALVRENEQLKGIIADQREDSELYSAGVTEGRRQAKTEALGEIERVRDAYAKSMQPTHEVEPILELLRVRIEDVGA